MIGRRHNESYQKLDVEVQDMERCAFEAEGRDSGGCFCLSSLHRGLASLRSVVSVLGFRTVICTSYVGYLFVERVFRLW